MTVTVPNLFCWLLYVVLPLTSDLTYKYSWLLQVKKNVGTVQLNASQYAKALASLTEENEKLKVKLKMYEAGKSATTPLVPPAVLPSYKDQLLLPFKELETMNKEILKLVKEIKLLKWRSRAKQKIADRLPCLSIDTIQMKKVMLYRWSKRGGGILHMKALYAWCTACLLLLG